jgi:hypothetical protein
MPDVAPVGSTTRSDRQRAFARLFAGRRAGLVLVGLVVAALSFAAATGGAANMAGNQKLYSSAVAARCLQADPHVKFFSLRVAYQGFSIQPLPDSFGAVISFGSAFPTDFEMSFSPSAPAAHRLAAKLDAFLIARNGNMGVARATTRVMELQQIVGNVLLEWGLAPTPAAKRIMAGCLAKAAE